MPEKAADTIPIFLRGKQKGLISEEIKPFIMRLGEISGIALSSVVSGAGGK